MCTLLIVEGGQLFGQSLSSWVKNKSTRLIDINIKYLLWKILGSRTKFLIAMVAGNCRDLLLICTALLCSIGHRSSGMRDSMDPEDRDGLGNPLPPIPVPDSTLGSPYENVRATRCGSRVPHSGGGGMDSSSPSTSPTHWEFYHSTKAHQGSSGDPTSV